MIRSLFFLLLISIFSIDARLYYIHIPKTGGSSIRTLLEKGVHLSEMYPRRMPIREENAQEAPPITHEVVSGHFPLWFCHQTDPDFDRAYKFTVLRDPVERFLSLLRYRKRKNPQFKSIEHVLEVIKQTENPSNLLCKFIASDPNATGDALLESAKKNVHCFDFIIFFDQFAEDVQTLCNLIGLEWEEETLPHLNTTDPEPVNPSLLAEAIQLNELDIALYEYVKTHYAPKNTSYRLVSPFYTNLMTKRHTIDYTFHMPMKGVNWCYRENVNAFSLQDPVYRYVMDKPAEISFFLEPHLDYILEFGAKPITKDIQPKVKVNGVELRVEKLTHKNFAAHQCFIPSSLITNDLTTFTFFSPKAYQYNILYPETGDNRKLSFAMDRIKIRAIRQR